MNLENVGFDEHGQLINNWVDTRSLQSPEKRRNFWRDRQGFGHWVAQAMGVGAMFVLFSVLWPAAKTMMGTTVTNMETLNSVMQSSLGDMTITAASGTSITLTFAAGITPDPTPADYTVSVNGVSDTVTAVGAASGQEMTLTLSTAMATGNAVNITDKGTSGEYSATGTAT